MSKTTGMDRVGSMVKPYCFNVLVDKLGLRASSIAMILDKVRF